MWKKKKYWYLFIILNIWDRIILLFKISIQFFKDFFLYFVQNIIKLTIQFFLKNIYLVIKSFHLAIDLFLKRFHLSLETGNISFYFTHLRFYLSLHLIDCFLSIFINSWCESWKFILFFLNNILNWSFNDENFEFLTLSIKIISLKNFFVQLSSLYIKNCSTFWHDLIMNLIDLSNKKIKHQNYN